MWPSSTILIKLRTILLVCNPENWSLKSQINLITTFFMVRDHDLRGVHFACLEFAMINNYLDQSVCQLQFETIKMMFILKY